MNFSIVDTTAEIQLAMAKIPEFSGKPAHVLHLSDANGNHLMDIVEAVFPCGGRSLYLVVSDHHEFGGTPKLVSFSNAVHVLQNLTEDELWGISARDPV